MIVRTSIVECAFDRIQEHYLHRRAATLRAEQRVSEGVLHASGFNGGGTLFLPRGYYYYYCACAVRTRYSMVCANVLFERKKIGRLEMSFP